MNGRMQYMNERLQKREEKKRERLQKLRSTPRKYAKVGDIVRIKVPRIMWRCGYPLNCDIIRRSHYQAIQVMVENAWEGIHKRNDDDELQELVMKAHSQERGMTLIIKEHLEKVACLTILQREGWGGNDRKIYERDSRHFQDKLFEVKGKSFVKTGTRVNNPNKDSRYTTMLTNVKTHCIYLLDNGNKILAVNCIVEKSSGKKNKNAKKSTGKTRGNEAKNASTAEGSAGKQSSSDSKESFIVLDE